MPHHLLRDRHIIVDLPIMHLELEPDEIRQDRRGARLRFYRGCSLARFGDDDGQTLGRDWLKVSRLPHGSELRGERVKEVDGQRERQPVSGDLTYGTILGPAGEMGVSSELLCVDENEEGGTTFPYRACQ